MVDDLAANSDVPVLRDCPGDGVQVDHDLHAVPGLFAAGLDVDDGGFTVVERDDVGTASECGGQPVQSKGVLAFDKTVRRSDAH